MGTIKEMTHTETNEAVARKLGWTFCEHGGARGAVRPNPIKLHFHEALPDYCHSIAAAWEIVDWFIREGYGFTINSSGRPRKWLVWIEEPTFVKTIIEEDADTAPMAICLAFLK